MRATSIAIALWMACMPACAGTNVGWRGDGSGQYPNARPALEWGRVSRAMAGLHCSAQRPEGDAPGGTTMPDGVIREWLVLGPLPVDAEAPETPDRLFSLDQAALRPQSNEEIGGARWKPVATDTAFLDLADLFDLYGKQESVAVYAHAYLFSPRVASLLLDVVHAGSAHVWLNGKLAHKPERSRHLGYMPLNVNLGRGWNRLLIRTTPQKGGPRSRPPRGTCYVNALLLGAPAPETEYEQQGILWKTAMPSVTGGFGGLIVVGDRIFLLSERDDLVCVDKNTGRILWVRSNRYDELAGADERKAHAGVFAEIRPLADRMKQINDSFSTGTPPEPEAVGGTLRYREKVELAGKAYELMTGVDAEKYALPKGQDVGYAGLTPTSDGRFVYAWFATGVTACYDFDGNCRWRRLDNLGKFFEHGFSSSPLLVDGKLIVFMNQLIGFDARTGERLWTTAFPQRWAERFHGSPAAARIGDEAVCVLPTGYVVRVSDGRILYAGDPQLGRLQQEIPSPVVVGDTVYRLSTYGKLHKIRLPAEAGDEITPVSIDEIGLDVSNMPCYYLDWHMSSPLVHDGLAYCLNNVGILTVVDVERNEALYRKLLDLDHVQSAHEGAGRGIGVSPALAGDYIFLMGNTGTTVIMKPGRTYRQVAKNRIENVLNRYWAHRHERFVACPVFDGERMYVRGERYLYCIGRK